MTKTFVKALLPLFTAFTSAGLAWCLLQETRVWVPVGVVAIFLFGFFASAFELGEQSLPAHPVRALWLMEWQRGAYWVMATMGAALVIRVGLLFPADLQGPEKELVGALSAGAVAFITAMFASVADDKVEETLADRIRTAFQSRYLRPGMVSLLSGLTVHRFRPATRGERLVHAARYEDISG